MDFILLDVLCDNDVIYTGILHDFNYSPKKDELENIILKSVEKCKVYDQEDDEEKNLLLGKSCSIDGDFFLIQASEIKNINIFYIEADDQGQVYDDPDPVDIIESAEDPFKP